MLVLQLGLGRWLKHWLGGYCPGATQQLAKALTHLLTITRGFGRSAPFRRVTLLTHP